MHIIIIGGGESGFELARALAERHDCYVVDSDPAVAERFASLNVQFVAGSGTSADTLRAVGVARCDVLVASTGQDEVNLVACSIARKFGHPETICFVSREEFLGSASGQGSLREHFGIDRVVWPEGQLADDIERIIVEPGAIDAEVFAGGQIRLIEYRLEPGSPATHRPLASLGLPRGSLIVAVKRAESLTIPRGGTVLEPGDKVVIMTSREATQEVRARLLPDRLASLTSLLVTIVGGGDVGARLAERLDADRRVTLRLIERDARRGEALASRLRRVLVIQGDGTDLELLESEEIGRSDVLVSVIDNDERNLLASLLGRQLGVKKVITRVSHRANLRLFERVGIDVALSARGAAVAAVVYHVEGGSTNLLAVLEEGQAQIVELVVPAGRQPTRLRDLGAPTESIVGAIQRGSHAFVPRGEDEIRAGDHLLVFTASLAAERVREFFAGSGR